MSGGSFNYAYRKDADRLIFEWYEKELRQMADAVDDIGRAASRNVPPEDAAQIAALLRAKADIIEAARRSVAEAFHKDVRDLMQAIEWAESGDSFKVDEAWDQYGEPNP